MAGFRMHVSTSTVLGVGYAGVLALGYGVPVDTAIVSGALCGFSGMLPDIDSETGVPLRETMAFSAAIVPMMLVPRLETFCAANGLGHDSLVLAAVAMYLFVRFGVANMIRKFTVHRGMFHSIPAMLIFTGLAFLVSGGASIEARYLKAGGVMAGFMSHLILDEIYAIEFAGGRWRLKKSFGTAIKFWGDDRWSNFSTYAKLSLVVMAILGEPAVMSQLQSGNPQFATQINDLRARFGAMAQQMPQLPSLPNNGPVATSNNRGPFSGAPAWPNQQNAPAPSSQQSTPWQWPAAMPSFNNGQPQPQFDTAQRPNSPFAQ